MTLNLLSISVMSAEVECLFSSCKIIITDCHNYIEIDAVEAIKCLKSWLQEKNIAWLDEDCINCWITEVEAEMQKEKNKAM